MRLVRKFLAWFNEPRCRICGVRESKAHMYVCRTDYGISFQHYFWEGE